MVHSRYHPLKHLLLGIVLGCCTVDIILLRIVLLGKCLDGAHCYIILLNIILLG